MSAARRKRVLSERQQVVLIIVGSAAAIVALWFFLLLPQARQREEIRSKWAQHQKSRYAHMSKADLENELQAVQENYSQVVKEWQATKQRLSTYTKSEALVGANVGKIDYKVELLNERTRLNEKSISLGIDLIPADLGMHDEVTSQEDARILLLQLRAIEKLADLALDRRITRLVAIEPMTPIAHRRENGTVFLEEYPVRAEFDISLETLYDLLHSVFERRRVFVFRQLRINTGRHKDAPLRVDAVMSALILK